MISQEEANPYRDRMQIARMKMDKLKDVGFRY
jgi:hypothetical protein